MDKLKPCPFCGETQFIDIYGIYDKNGDVIGDHITCGGCMAHFQVEDAVKQDEVIAGWNRRVEETPPQGWISVEDSLPPEHDTIFAKLYGTDKWRNVMFRKMSDDVRVVKVFRDGTRRVHHDHTVDGVWASERKGPDTYGHVTHWMANPELPEVTQE